jgi:hypothetical protein
MGQEGDVLRGTSDFIVIRSHEYVWEKDKGRSSVGTGEIQCKNSLYKRMNRNPNIDII